MAGQIQQEPADCKRELLPRPGAEYWGELAISEFGYQTVSRLQETSQTEKSSPA